MEIYDTVISFKFSPPVVCYQSCKEQKLYEKFKIPKLSNKILEIKSSFLHAIHTIIEEDDFSTALIRFDLHRNLEFVISKMKKLEETYISLIIFKILKMVLFFHEELYSGINFNISNFTITPSQEIVLRNRFTLVGNLEKECQDWSNFCQFAEKIIFVDEKDMRKNSISKKFQDFINAFRELRTSELTPKVKFKRLLETKFVNVKVNILNDLVDDLKLMPDSEVRSYIDFEVKNIKEIEPLEKSGNPINLGDESVNLNKKKREILRRKQLIELIGNIFDKYEADKNITGKVQISNLLSNIRNSLLKMEDQCPYSSLKIMEQLIKTNSV